MLVIEFIREGASPRLQFLGDQLLKDGGKGTFFSDALIASHLVYQGNDGRPHKGA